VRFFLALLVLLFCGTVLADGKLKKVKKDLEKPRAAIVRESSFDDDEDATDWEIFYIWLEAYFVYTFSDGGFRYGRYPYESGLRGYLTNEEVSERPFALDILTGYKHIDSETDAFLFDVRLRLPSGSAFSLTYTRFEEELDTGGYEYLSFYSIMQRASLFGNQPFDITLDVGGCHFPGTGYGGFSYGAGVEVYPQSPLLFHFYIRGHMVSTGANVTESLMALGVVLRNVELLVGYRVWVLRFLGWC